MQMDEVTQQNAALVEEASAAAQSMAAQSNTLRELVSIFTIDASDVSAHAFAPAPTLAVKKPVVSAKMTRQAPSLAKDAAWTTF